jgi:hypothetical protein
MNVMILIAVGVGGLGGLWLVQTLTLQAVGHARPLAWPLRHDSDSDAVRWVLKGALQLVLVGLLVVPWLTGSSPLDYYATMVLPARFGVLAATVAVTLALFSAAIGTYLLTGLVTWAPQHQGLWLAAKLLRVSLTPLPLALMEETVFRGVILEQLLRSLPGTPAGQFVALVVSAAVFSSVHFVRQQKRILLPAVGLFTLGLTLGLGYLLGGHTLWLPVAIHAAGVWFTQVSRAFLNYSGPDWLIGYRSYPICGAVGLAGLCTLMGWVYLVA